MLILTRKPGESLYIGDNVKVTIVEIKGHQIRVGIEAPKELRIYREEIYLQILEENRKAAMSNEVELGLESLSQAWGAGAPESESREEGGKPAPRVRSLVPTGVRRAPSEKSAHEGVRVPLQTAAEASSPKVVVKRKRKGSNEPKEE